MRAVGDAVVTSRFLTHCAMSPGFGGQAWHSLPRPGWHRATMSVNPGGQAHHGAVPWDRAMGPGPCKRRARGGRPGEQTVRDVDEWGEKRGGGASMMLAPPPHHPSTDLQVLDAGRDKPMKTNSNIKNPERRTDVILYITLQRKQIMHSILRSLKTTLPPT